MNTPDGLVWTLLLMLTSCTSPGKGSRRLCLRTGNPANLRAQRTSITLISKLATVHGTILVTP